MDDLEQKMKEKLLEGLIEHMSGKMGDDLESRFPKPMAVEVAAPTKDGLKTGLDHAKDIADAAPESDDSDEDRLMALLGEDDDGDEDDDKKGL